MVTTSGLILMDNNPEELAPYASPIYEPVSETESWKCSNCSTSSNELQSRLVESMNSWFRQWRFLHSDHFSDFVSTNYDQQQDYTYGIFFVSSCIGVFLVLWMTALLILKCQGGAVGCAAGYHFQTLDEYPQSETGNARHRVHGASSTDSEDFNSSIESCSELPTRPSSSGSDDPSIVSYVDTERNRKRARRTRIAFLFFGTTTLACIICLLIFAFASIRETLVDTRATFDDAQGVIDEVGASLMSIESAGDHIEETFNRMTFDLNTACPTLNNTETVLGVDLRGFHRLTNSEYEAIADVMANNITVLNSTLKTIQSTKNRVERAVETTSDNLWVVPGFVLVVALCATTGMLATILAWRGRSGRWFQWIVSYIVLPAFLVICLASWAAVLATSTATILSGDACVAGGEQYGPDDTIQDILQAHSVNPDGPVHLYVTAFTHGCQVGDPNRDLVELEAELGITINEIWRQLSIVDSVGRRELADACGGSLDDLLEGARLLAKSLTSIQKALDSTVSTLQCDRVNPIYVEAVHDQFCGDIANAASLSFVLLLVVAFATTVMLSIRAAWYHQVEEELVYNDDEVADNMILDEHEEYLAYISKYKHEWQEYRGFNSNSLPQSEDEDSEDGERQQEAEYPAAGVPSASSASVSYLEDVPINDSFQDEESLENRSQDTEDISFMSLQVPDDVEAVPVMLPRLDHEYDDEREDWELQPISSRGYGEEAPLPTAVIAEPMPPPRRTTSYASSHRPSPSLLSLPCVEDQRSPKNEEEGVELTLAASAYAADRNTFEEQVRTNVKAKFLDPDTVLDGRKSPFIREAISAETFEL